VIIAKGLIFTSSIIILVGIGLFSSWFVLDFNLLIGVLAFIFLSVGVAILIYSIIVLKKYWKESKDDPKKYLHKRYRRSQGADN